MGRYEKNKENQCFVMWVTADRNLRNLRIAESLCPVSGKQWKSSEKNDISLLCANALATFHNGKVSHFEQIYEPDAFHREKHPVLFFLYILSV